jgi:hypothetical protein
MDSKSIQIGLINVVMGVGFLLLLLMQRTLTSNEAWIFWIATATFFFHWYWGLVYFINYIGPTQNFPEMALDLIGVGLVVSAMLWIDVPYIWFGIFAATFAFAVIKYLLAARFRKLSSRVKSYINEKIKIEAGALIMFVAGAFLTFYYKAALGLGILTLALHLLTVSYLLFKKVYTLHD